MAKQKPSFEIHSYGIYDGWDESSKKLPKIKTFTTNIPAVLDIEFGLILQVKRGKGICLDWIIYHPDVCDKKGRPMPPFEGEVYVRTNDWEFYLGDTIWEPIENAEGDWHMMLSYKDKCIAEKTFSVAKEHGDGEIQFWKKRGY
ncbi:DUF3859 domain-containing protein [Agaribacter flavus]|uniref:DUF3859 domain-containing protein n=1 Tax=Agaribacter flavus TaxID=1902781 RepID=A0ABV7FS40_9ALTE